MRLGLIVRADNGGLGNQTWELYKHLKPVKTLVIDLSEHNKQHGQHGYDNHMERFNEGEITVSPSFPQAHLIDEWLEGLDIVLTVETPYSYYLYDAARAMGVKTAVQFNFEFLDWFVHPEWPKPDLMLAPSPWNLSQINANFGRSIWGTQLKYIPVPVNRLVFPFKPRTQAKTFLHIAGHSTYEDRNGTRIVLEAIPLVKSDVKFVIRSQYEMPHMEHDYRVNVMIKDVPNYWELYNGEDVLLLPRKYGGLSLQLHEAMSTGMIPVMPNVEPQNTFLNPETLVAAQLTKTIAPRTPIEVWECSPQDLAAKIDEIANMPPEKITELSQFSNTYAESISWDNMTRVYIEALEECLRS